MLKEKFIVSIMLLILGMAAACPVFMSPTALEKRFFFVALALFGVPMLLVVAWNWKRLLSRTGYYGYSFERPLEYPSSSSNRTISVFSAIGASLGVPLISIACFYLGVPKDAMYYGLAGLLAGISLPMSGGTLVAATLTSIRWWGE